MTNERYAALEAEAAEKRRAKARRQPLLLIGLTNALVLAVGATAAIDLRRLQTPEGTALAWTQAATFGVCDDYLGLSVADPSLPDRRSRDDLCDDLRTGTAEDRELSSEIGLRLGTVTETGNRAEVSLVLTRDDVDKALLVRLVRGEDGWRVIRDSVTCGSVGCA